MAAWKVSKDRAEISQHGFLNLIDGKLYIDEIPLAQMFEQFAGQHVYVSLIRPDMSREIEIDDKIQPLVKALNSKGFSTLGCCEGHLGEDWDGEPLDKPYVSFVETIPFPYELPKGWSIQRRQHGVCVLTTDDSPETQMELDRQQAQINELVKTITE